MQSKQKSFSKYLHTLFEASVVIKAANGVWETITGLAILLFSRIAIANAFYDITKREMSHSTQNLAGVYILAHGLVNLFLAYYLYKEKLWAFWVSVAFFATSSLFLFQKASHHPSMILYGLALFDIACIYLTLHEYSYRKTLKTAPASMIEI